MGGHDGPSPGGPAVPVYAAPVPSPPGTPVTPPPETIGFEVIQTNGFYAKIRTSREALDILRDYLVILEKKVGRSNPTSGD